MTSKVIEGHKSSSNFSVNQTLPLLDGPLMLPPFALCKNNLHTTKIFRYAVSLHVTYFCVRLYSGIRLSCKTFWWYLTLYFAVQEILRGIKGKIFSHLYLRPFTLSIPFPSYLSHLSFSLSPSLSLFLSLKRPG